MPFNFREPQSRLITTEKSNPILMFKYPPFVTYIFLFVAFSFTSCAQPGIPEDKDMLVITASFEKGFTQQEAESEFSFVADLKGVYDIRVNANTGFLFVYAEKSEVAEQVIRKINKNNVSVVLDHASVTDLQGHAEKKLKMQSEVSSTIDNTDQTKNTAQQWKAQKAEEYQKNKEDFLKTQNTQNY